MHRERGGSSARKALRMPPRRTHRCGRMPLIASMSRTAFSAGTDFSRPLPSAGAASPARTRSATRREDTRGAAKALELRAELTEAALVRAASAMVLLLREESRSSEVIWQRWVESRGARQLWRESKAGTNYWRRAGDNGSAATAQPPSVASALSPLHAQAAATPRRGAAPAQQPSLCPLTQCLKQQHMPLHCHAVAPCLIQLPTLSLTRL